MRNLKKFLALVLAMMMVMSLMVTVNAASSDFSDADKITPTYVEAVDVLSALKVLEGDSRGFRPGDKITRAEAAAVLYRIHSGDTDKNSPIPDFYRDLCAAEFTDVIGTGSDWAAGFIGYAVNEGLVVGRGNGKFDPGANVTGYEMQTMLLRALGYDQKGEFLGNGYITESTKLATTWGILTNIPAGILRLDATREIVAEMTFRTVAYVPQVTYNELLGVYNPTDGLWGNITANFNPTLGWENFGLALIEGELIAVDQAKDTIKIAPYTTTTTIEGNVDTAGGTQLNKRDAYTVHDIDAITWADVENIGYKVCVWGVKGITTDVRNYDAITDYEVIGKSLLTTDGHYDAYDLDNNNTTTITEVARANRVTLSDIAVDKLDSNTSSEVRVYFNGEQIPIGSALTTGTASGSQLKIGTDVSAGDYYYNTTYNLVYYKPMSGSGDGRPVNLVNGLKVEYIDNDEGGEVEVISITEYTVATVAGIANDKNTGHNAIVRDYYYFNAYNTAVYNDRDDYEGRTATAPTTVPVHKDYLVADAELAVGNVVTYVEYAGDYYVTKSVPEVTKLTRVYDITTLNREASFLFSSSDEPYYKASEKDGGSDNHYAQLYFRNDIPNSKTMTRSAIGDLFSVYCDPYGYIIAATEDVATNDYLFVDVVNHSDAVEGIAKARVVFPNGSVEVAYLDIDDNEDFEDYAGHVYAYEYDEDTDLYTLFDADPRTDDFDFWCDDVTVDLKSTITEAVAEIGKIYFDESTQFIDVRNVKASTTSVDVKTRSGFSTTLTGARLHCIVDGDRVVYAFIKSGTATTAGSALDFIVYQTEFAYSERDMLKDPVNPINFLEVLTGGEKKVIELKANQYAEVMKYGVGHYKFNTSGNLTSYTAFPEEWEPVSWYNGTLVIESGDNKGDSYYYNNSSVKFWTLDIEDGEAYNYEPYYGTNWYAAGEAMAYLVSGSSGLTQIYVVYGDLAVKGDTGVKTVTSKYGEYYVKDGYITDFDPYPVYTAWLTDGTDVIASAPVIDNGDKTQTLTFSLKEAGVIKPGYTFTLTDITAKYYWINGGLKEELEYEEISFNDDWITTGTQIATEKKDSYTELALVQYDPEKMELTITRVDNKTFNCYFEFTADFSSASDPYEDAGDGGHTGGWILGDGDGEAGQDFGSTDSNHEDELHAIISETYKALGITVSADPKTHVITIEVDEDEFYDNEDTEGYRLAEGQLENDSYQPKENERGYVGVPFEILGDNKWFTDFTVTRASTNKTNKTAKMTPAGNEIMIYEWFSVAEYVDGVWTLLEEDEWSVSYYDNGTKMEWTVEFVIGGDD